VSVCACVYTHIVNILHKQHNIHSTDTHTHTHLWNVDPYRAKLLEERVRHLQVCVSVKRDLIHSQKRPIQNSAP
jgi:hypothetical protein